MKRFLVTLLVVTALACMPYMLHPLAVSAASAVRTIPMSNSVCDGQVVHFNDGPVYYTVSGHQIKDSGDSCYAFNPVHNPGWCPVSYCWDVQASTTISPSVYKTYADAYGYDWCGSNPYNLEMGNGVWASGSFSETPVYYGTFQDCDGQGHGYQTDYGHFFEYSSSSGSLGFTTCRYDGC